MARLHVGEFRPGDVVATPLGHEAVVRGMTFGRIELQYTDAWRGSVTLDAGHLRLVRRPS